MTIDYVNKPKFKSAEYYYKIGWTILTCDKCNIIMGYCKDEYEEGMGISKALCLECSKK